jgi:glycosyltransferase involved in cell wall biosynthesis
MSHLPGSDPANPEARSEPYDAAAAIVPRQDGPGLLSVVIPAYNEEEVLAEFHRRLTDVLAGLGGPYEVLYVNDGSCDRTPTMLRELARRDPHVGFINLSRNFGKEIALTAGLDKTRGDATVVIDADLQDPPELIPALIGQWRLGHDVVYARRTVREGETWLKKATAHAFYRVMRRLGGRVQIPEDTGDFRLLSRRAVEALRQLREHHRFMKGLFTWVGFSQVAVPYRRDPRFAGDSKWNYWKLWNFSLEGITSFSTAPLRFASYFGLATATASFFYGLFIISKTVVFGDPVKGFPALMTVVSFLGGVQLVTLGIMGEYLGRVFNETKRRPLYVLADCAPPRVGNRASGPESQRGLDQPTNRKNAPIPPDQEGSEWPSLT